MSKEKPAGSTGSDAETRVGWRMAGLGMEVATQVAAGALLGWLFDRWRGHGTAGVLTGSIIGIVVGLWSLIKGSLKLSRELDRTNPIRTPEGGWKKSEDDDDTHHEPT